MSWSLRPCYIHAAHGVTLAPPRLRGLYVLRAAVEFVLLAWFTGVMLLPLGDFGGDLHSVLLAALAARVVLKEQLGRIGSRPSLSSSWAP